MDADVTIKVSFMTCLTVMYSVVFLTQRFDVASTSALVSTFTNAVVGVVTYNLAKRKLAKEKKGDEK